MTAIDRPLRPGFGRPSLGSGFAAGMVATGIQRSQGLQMPVLRFLGVVMNLAAVGIWFMPGERWDAEMVLIKLAVSVLFMCVGLALLHSGRHQTQDELHLDLSARELRHVVRGADGVGRLKTQCGFADLIDVQYEDGLFSAIGKDGVCVLQVHTGPIDNIKQIRKMIA